MNYISSIFSYVKETLNYFYTSKNEGKNEGKNAGKNASNNELKNQNKNELLLRLLIGGGLSDFKAKSSF